MLRELKITNLALIEELHVAFESGLTVLTGETGAGKSIILQAIHLLSGGRAAASWVRTGADKATVEALFEMTPEHEILFQTIHDMGIEAEDGVLVIKRLLSSAGKSKFYINGGMATAKVAGAIAENLLSVASQHDHQQLLMPKYHLDFIDAVGDLWAERQALAALHGKWSEVKAAYRRLREQEKDKEQRRDFLAYQCKEIEDAGIVEGEDVQLLQEKERLKASVDLTRLGRESYGLLNGTVVDALARVRKNLEQMAGFDPAVGPLSEEVAGYGYQLEDSMAQLRNYVDAVPNDPAQLDTITARIDVLQQLKRKYGATLAEVLECAELGREELATLDDLDQRLGAFSRELADMESELVKRAGALSAARHKTGKLLVQKIGEELRSLCLEQSRFEVRFNNGATPGIGELTGSGWDKPEFLFSANPGEPVKPVAKVASGGELSRLMLALKCLLARKDQVETVIFDEVDAGISGKTAEAVARKIKELGGHHQVLCITHLPQIASCAREHFQVTKSVAEERTHTRIAKLSHELQIHELARMLDGDSVTPQTKAYAEELLERNQ